MAENSVVNNQTERASNSVAERQKRITDEFLLLDDWNDRYHHLIDLGKSLPPLAPCHYSDCNRVAECHGNTFLAGQQTDRRLLLFGASDIPILAGILAVLIDVYSGFPTAEILRHPPVFLDNIGLTRRLSPHRRVALLRIHERLLALAADSEVPQKLAS